MSWSKSTTIWCDACSEWRRFSNRAVKGCRKILREEGWRCSSDADYCADCVEEGEHHD